MKYQIEKWLDILLTILNEAGIFCKEIVSCIRNYEKLDRGLPSITEQPCQCSECGWTGTVWDCKGNVDNDGSLGCPECLEVIKGI